MNFIDRFEVPNSNPFALCNLGLVNLRWILQTQVIVNSCEAQGPRRQKARSAVVSIKKTEWPTDYVKKGKRMTKAGSCHCGKVRFEIEAHIDSVLSCNCSICKRRGTLLIFVPIEKFKMISGADSLVNYQFGKKRIHHYFCSTCGVTPFGAGKNPDGSEVRAVNVRCLDEVDLNSIKINHFDGARL